MFARLALSRLSLSPRLGLRLASVGPLAARQLHQQSTRAKEGFGLFFSSSSSAKSGSTAGLSLASFGATVALGMAAAGCDAADPAQTVVHQDTGLTFPSELPGPEGSAQSLLGLGLRKVTFLYFKVYVVGFYLPTGEQMKRKLASMGSQKLTMDELSEKIMVSQEIPKSLRIAACSSVAGSHLRDGLGRSLEKFLPSDKAQKEIYEREIAKFKTFFPKGQIEKGQAMVFSLYQGKVVVSFEGTQTGEIDSTFVAENLVRAYLGAKPVTKDAKQNIQKGLQGSFADCLVAPTK